MQKLIWCDLYSLREQRVLLLHEVMDLRVDPFNDGHQIVQNVFCVVHGRIHEVPEQEEKTGSIFKSNIDSSFTIIGDNEKEPVHLRTRNQQWTCYQNSLRSSRRYVVK